MTYEAEIPGIRVTREHLQIICSRYYFAAQFVAGKQVLEVGCGPGLGLGYLSQRADGVIGGDLAQDNLRLAREHYGARVGLALLDAHYLPFKDNCFDVVLAMATVVYLRLDSFLSECYRVLKRGGVLVFCIPNKEHPGFRTSPLSRNYFSLPELSALLSGHFEARFFGAFPAPKALPATSLRDMIIAKAGTTLAQMPRGREIKEFLSRFLFGTSVLKAEIEEGMVAIVPPEPIGDGSAIFQYRILYIVAHSR